MFARLFVATSLLIAAAPAHAVSQATKDFVIANCKADGEKFCSWVIPGGGRIAECLKAHKEQITANCRDALLKAKAEEDAGK
jgi:hypothetical protein